MSRAAFFPYPFASSGLHLTCELDAEGLEDGDGRRILAEGVPEAGSVRFKIRVSLDDDVLDRVLAPEERGAPPISAVVAARSIPSRRREVIRLDATDGYWTGVVDWPKADLFGEVVFEPALIRTSDGSNEAYAGHLGALLASGDPVTLEVDEPPVPPGGFLDIRFENFRESGNAKRSSNPDLLYMLDTDRDTPILWLNEAIDEFKPVMLTKAPRGGSLRVRDAMFDTIVSQVWTALASIAFCRLALETQTANDDAVESDPLDALPDWHQRVINFWAPQLFDGSKTEAIEQVIDASTDAALVADLWDRLSLAVQKQARTAYAFRGLVRLRDREGV
jgi:hypothetical protein